MICEIGDDYSRRAERSQVEPIEGGLMCAASLSSPNTRSYRMAERFSWLCRPLSPSMRVQAPSLDVSSVPLFNPVVPTGGSSALRFELPCLRISTDSLPTY